MLQYEVARKFYEELKSAASRADEELKEFYNDFLLSATKYANNRLSWSFMDLAARREDDERRHLKHDSFMAILTAICRNLAVEGLDEAMPDRKTKGDFACYISLFLSLEQR
ncbi:MAG: hypothetical protein J6K89_08795 [Oscillospiraceae bacterium]|nr:hypothetical protein [Oscillospiraceae bacterium]